MIAAPVGVQASYGTPPTTGALASVSTRSTAGAGSGIDPCEPRVVPPPTVTVEAVNRSMPKAAKPAAAPTMSAIESSAPTSWKCTSSASIPCAAASAAARRENASNASLRAGSFRAAPSSIARMDRQRRSVATAGASTSTFVATSPCRVTLLACKRIGSVPSASTAACITARSTPASTRVPRNMSPLAPAEQSSHATAAPRSP